MVLLFQEEGVVFIGNARYGFSSDYFHRGLNINFLKLIYGNKPHSFLLCLLCHLCFFRKYYKIDLKQ